MSQLELDPAIDNGELLARLRGAGRAGVSHSELAELRFVRLRIRELRDAGYVIGEAPDVDPDGDADIRFVLFAEPTRQLDLDEGGQGPQPPGGDPARNVCDEPPLRSGGPN